MSMGSPHTLLADGCLSQRSDQSTCGAQSHDLGSLQLSEPVDNSNMRPHQQDLPIRNDLSRNTTEDRQEEEPAPSKNQSRYRKRWNLSATSWNKQKKAIFRLYLEDNKTLDETMAIMREAHSFSASKKLFKDKLKEWGYTKNLKQKDVRDIVRQTKNREGRETEVLIGGINVPVTRVERSYHRLRAGSTVNSCDELVQSPTKIVVRTPEHTGLNPLPTGEDLSSQPTKQVTLRLPFSIAADGPFDIQSFQADGRGLSLETLLALRKATVEQITEGRLEEASTSLKAVLSGLESKYSALHPGVLDAAWGLAKVHIRRNSLQEVDSVMNWISAHYAKELGLWHPRTLLHYDRVLEALKTQFRFEDAKMLGYHFLRAAKSCHGSQDMIFIPQSEAIEINDLDILESMNLIMDAAICEPVHIDQFLRLLKLWSSSGLFGVEEVLYQLILHLESSDLRLKSQILDAKCISIAQCFEHKGHLDPSSQCKLAREDLAKFIRSSGIRHLEDSLRITRELAVLHLRDHDPTGYTKVLNWATKTLTDMVTASSRHMSNAERINLLIDHLIQVGQDCQDRSGWTNARGWFEKACGLSLKYLGPAHQKSLALERALKEQHYTYCYDYSQN